MQKLGIILIITAGWIYAKSTSDLPMSAQKAFAGKRDIFSGDYLADAFAKWSRKIRFTPGSVDTQKVDGLYQEIWINSEKRQSPSKTTLVFVLTNEATAKIVEVRRLFFNERAGFSRDEQTVMDFIEKLLWLHETGEESFEFDHLYPSFIKCLFNGNSNKKVLVKALQQRYPGSLPLKRATWEKQGPYFQIHLQFDNDISGMELIINIEKYLTVHAFEMRDQVEMVRMLVDSIKSWSAREEINAGKAVKVAASSPAAAIDRIVAPLTTLYHIKKRLLSDTMATIQITAPSLDSLESSPLQFQIRMQKEAEGNFVLQVNDVVLGNHHQPAPLDTFKQVIDKCRYRYGALGFPPLFWPAAGTATTSFKLRIHGHSIDSLLCDNVAMADKLLAALTHGKQVFFHVRDIQSRTEGILAKGIGIWKDPHLYRHHLAKITERFVCQHSRVQRIESTIDLYPFIRTDNLMPNSL